MNRKIFNVLALVALCAQLSAVEVYKNGDKSVSVFGEINVGIGYGSTLDYPITISNGKSNYSIKDAYNKTKHSFMLGIQRDSRVGIGFNVSGLFGEATLGLGENFMTNADYFTTTLPLPNLRQLYLGYDFGKSGRILAGKTELNTSMGGFISDIANEEEGLWGYGAPRNFIRRFQVRYEIAGFSIAIGPSNANYYLLQESVNRYMNLPKLKRLFPKFSFAYQYNNDKLRAKVGSYYTCIGSCSGNNDNYIKESRHIFYLTAGIKPYFGKSYLSFVLSYGLNIDLTNEGKIWYQPYINQKLKGYGNLSLNEIDSLLDAKNGTGGLYDERILEIFYAVFAAHSNFPLSQIIQIMQQRYGVTPISVLGLDTSDRNIYATALEFGHNFTDKVALKIGLGYQIATSYDRTIRKYDILHSFGGFIQVPCKINDYFTIIPQTGGRIIVREDITNTNANEYKFDFNSNAMALLLMKFIF